jgi:hypothetical protein
MASPLLRLLAMVGKRGRLLILGGAMKISSKRAAGLLLTVLLCEVSLAGNSLTNGAKQDPVAAMTITPCALLTPAVTQRLPWFLKPRDVVCMSVTIEDVRESERARILLMDAGERSQSDDRFSTATTEYHKGIAAYSEGRYTDAVSHFQAAITSGR